MHKYHHKNKTLFFYSVAFLEADAIFKILHIFSCEGAALEVLKPFTVLNLFSIIVKVYVTLVHFTIRSIQLSNLRGHHILMTTFIAKI